MKRTHVIYLMLMTFIFLSSCSSDDEGNSNPTSSLSGVWHLDNVSGGWQPHTVTYDRGMVIWVFDINQQMLEIQNNLSAEENTIGMSPTGNYPYALLTTGDYTVLQIDGSAVLGEFILTDDTLVIDGRSSDGFQYIFVR